jgi:uncharacterized protein (DUF2164 family)
MSIELDKDSRKEAIASIERYFKENFDEPHNRIGNIAASGLLGYFLEEIGPLIYNQAVAEVQERLQVRVSELDIELHEKPLMYWRRREQSAKKR